MNKKYVKSYLSLGANIGNKFFYILSAINEINNLDKVCVENVSDFYKTEPYGNENQEEFINCAVKIKTKLLPYELLKKINEIENKLGRKRLIKWGPRTIDIDIIFYDNLNINRGNLIIPHKEYKKRNFVLYPLKDITKSINILKYIDESKGKIEKYEYAQKILISLCLLGVDCKYNSKNNLRKLFKDILKLDYSVICPETMGGLKAPREPAEIQKNGDVVDKIGKDVTKFFYDGAKKAVEIAEKNNVEIALMKSKSPSCGYGEVYDGTFSNKLVKRNGITCEKLEKKGIKIITVK